jgi:hypothetical protein
MSTSWSYASEVALKVSHKRWSARSGGPIFPLREAQSFLFPHRVVIGRPIASSDLEACITSPYHFDDRYAAHNLAPTSRCHSPSSYHLGCLRLWWPSYMADSWVEVSVWQAHSSALAEAYFSSRFATSCQVWDTSVLCKSYTWIDSPKDHLTSIWWPSR